MSTKPPVFALHCKRTQNKKKKPITDRIEIGVILGANWISSLYIMVWKSFDVSHLYKKETELAIHFNSADSYFSVDVFTSSLSLEPFQSLFNFKKFFFHLKHRASPCVCFCVYIVVPSSDKEVDRSILTLYFFAHIAPLSQCCYYDTRLHHYIE